MLLHDNACVLPACRPQVGLAWLDRWAAGIAGKDQGPTLCMSIASQLFAAQSTGLGPDELAAQLLDLLGDAAFEAVGQLLERRCGGAAAAPHPLACLQSTPV